MIYFFVALIVLPLLWLVMNYNGLVRLRQHVKESWADIDTELKRRYDLIPNLVETVKGYAAHESALFEKVALARSNAVSSNGAPEKQSVDEVKLVGELQRLLAVAEDYPDLKASEHYLSLQKQLIHTEDRIQAARRFYNGNVRDLNTRIEVFPTNLIASAFKFKPVGFFEVKSSVVREVIDVSFNQEIDS
jgi:LemA protein